MSAGHHGWEGFTKWERELARKKAEEKAKRLGRTAIESDDLEQEFLLEIWLKRESFNPKHQSKSSMKAFIRSVLENRFKHLARAEFQDKRVVHGLMDSLDREIESDEGDKRTLADLTPEELHPEFELTEALKEAITKAIESLSESQRAIVQMILSGHKLSDIARKTKRPWSSIKDEIIRMRRVLYNAGLSEFLDSRDFPEKPHIG